MAEGKIMHHPQGLVDFLNFIKAGKIWVAIFHIWFNLCFIKIEGSEAQSVTIVWPNPTNEKNI